jgi:ABC-type nitrate/sulfonate/bicarbonate transport system substrate-binding protein
MKRVWIGIIILVVLVAVGFGVKTKVFSGGSTKGGSVSDLTFAKVEPLTIPAVGGYQLSKADLGDGPVPVIQVPLDTWGGYAALFAANGNSLKPNKDSIFYKKGKFGVEIVREESATEQLKGYASGKWPIIWTQVDGLPMIYDAFKADKRIMPKVLGLFDWSNGGDGILVRNSIKDPSDLKGKIILTSSNTAYSFMLLWYLAQNNLSGKDVKVVWIDDGDKALQIFKGNSNVAAWVTWTPFLNDCLDSKSKSYVADTRLLISSKDANQLIADVYMVRNDLFTDKPDIMQAFAAAMMAGSAQIDNSTYNVMATFYKVSAGDAKAMLDDVHIANYPENKMFFDENNAAGANKIFYLSEQYNKDLGTLSANASYDPSRVISSKIMTAIDKTGEFSGQQNAMLNSFNKKASFDVADLESQRVVLKNNVQLFFEAQRLEFDPNSGQTEIKDNMKLLDQVAGQAKFLGTTVLKLDGYLDTTKMADFKAQGAQAFAEAAAQAKMISKKRAEFVKSLLVKQYGIDSARILTEGKGWDNPIDDKDPTKNRRVEVKFISLE